MNNKPMPVKLPEDLVRKPTIYVRDMRPGESAWIAWVDMVIDQAHRCFLNPDAKVLQEQSDLSVRVTRTAAGFEVLIPAMQVFPSWSPGAFPINDTFFPVIKLERATGAEPGGKSNEPTF
jgi:hypothetical protein